VLVRASLLLATAAIAISATACSSLTKPDEIKIWAEPPPAPRGAAGAAGAQAPPLMPSHGAPAAGNSGG
jgi:hypothetical protein